jgi:hypothetical protein
MKTTNDLFKLIWLGIELEMLKVRDVINWSDSIFMFNNSDIDIEDLVKFSLLKKDISKSEFFESLSEVYEFNFEKYHVEFFLYNLKLQLESGMNFELVAPKICSLFSYRVIQDLYNQDINSIVASVEEHFSLIQDGFIGMNYDNTILLDIFNMTLDINSTRNYIEFMNKWSILKSIR